MNKIKFKAQDSNGNAKTDVVHYQLSNKQFVNCNLAAGASDITNGVKSVTTGNEVELTIDGVDGLLWLNMYADTAKNQSLFELLLRLVNAVESISLILFSWLTSEAPGS